MRKKKPLAVELVWSELLLCGGEWKTRKAIYEELIAEGYERRYVDWYLFCLSQYQPKERTMEQEINGLLFEIDHALEQSQELASAINRGPGGREVALTITNMQYAKWTLAEGLRIIVADKAKQQQLKDGE